MPEIYTPEAVQASFNAELQRLYDLGISPELEALARRYYSDKERKSMDASDFCGPNRSFPVKSQEDVTNATGLAGHAANPDAVRACIRSKAKANGWKLPDSWEEEDSKDRALSRAGNHAPMSGKHSHAHPAFGSQGDDATHAHSHSHDNDADHHHSHDDEEAAPESDTAEERAATNTTPFNVYLPITRSDANERRVYGQATVEQPDAYGTIFGYHPEAWREWRGNIREQHDPKKAVGKALEVTPDPTERAIFVDAKVSRGAQDTWLKVEDGVLTGFSASILPDAQYGNDTRNWPKKEYNGKEYPYLPRYSVVELSLVDNPATPGCNISIVRANGIATEILDVTEEEAVQLPQETPKPVERAGARISGDSQTALHEARNASLLSAVKIMSHCACGQCTTAMHAFDPDNDGDIDMLGLYDPDGDGGQLQADGVSDTREMEERLTAVVERLFQPIYVRFQAIAGQYARNNTTHTESIQALERSLQSQLGTALEERISEQSTAFVSSVKSALDESLVRVLASLDEVRPVLTGVKDQVDKIAAQPASGGPVLNGAYPVDKRLATDPYAPTGGGLTPEARLAFFDELKRKGLLTSDLQIEASKAAMLRVGRS